MAGDEDLREGMAKAQKLGLQVVLLGMPVEEGHNQSARLVRECDEYLVLPRETWEPHCTRRSDAGDGEDERAEVAAARRVGASSARAWAQRTEPDELQPELDGFPTLPPPLDLELLLAVEEELGSLRQRPDLKSELRGTFWFALRETSRR